MAFLPGINGREMTAPRWASSPWAKSAGGRQAQPAADGSTLHRLVREVICQDEKKPEAKYSTH